MPQGHLVASLFAAYFFGFGLFLPFFPLVLRDAGLGAGEIGTLLALPMLVRLAANPLIGAAADRFATPGQAIAALSLASALLFLAVPFVSGFWPIAALLVLVAVVWSPLVPISDAVAARLDRDGHAQYGRMRLWGSVSFIAANLIGGLAATGACAGLVVIGGIVAGLLVSALLALKLDVAGARSDAADARPALQQTGPQAGGSATGSATGSGWGLAGFMLVVLGAGILQGSHAAYYGFSALFWETAGFGGPAIGALWGLGVTTEILLFAFAARIGLRIGPVGILALGALATILRWALFAQATDPLATGALQLLHGLTFGATHLGAVAFVAAHAPARWGGLSQGLLSMVIGLFTALASALAGQLYTASAAAAFEAMALMAAVGTALLALGAVALRPRGPAQGEAGGGPA